MVDDSKMVSIQDSEPVTRFEFRTAICDVKGLLEERFEEAKRDADERTEEVKRHAGVLHEDLVHKMDLLIEAVSPVTERVTRHEDRLSALEADVDLLKTLARSRR